MWDLVASLAAAAAGHQDTSPVKSLNPLHGDEDVGSVEWYCERVLDPLFVPFSRVTQSIAADAFSGP